MRFLRIGFMLIFSASMVFGQQIKNGPPPSPSPPAAKSIPLTPDEVKDLRIDGLENDKLVLQIDQLQRQVTEAQQKRARETQELLDRLAKAHNIDQSKYRLDRQANAFVPNPSAPAHVEVKPKP